MLTKKTLLAAVTTATLAWQACSSSISPTSPTSPSPRWTTLPDFSSLVGSRWQGVAIVIVNGTEAKWTAELDFTRLDAPSPGIPGPPYGIGWTNGLLTGMHSTVADLPQFARIVRLHACGPGPEPYGWKYPVWAEGHWTEVRQSPDGTQLAIDVPDLAGCNITGARWELTRRQGTFGGGL